MQIGATYNFEKCEVYFPEDTDSAGYQTIQDLVGDPEPVESGIGKSTCCSSYSSPLE
jgi:hypothetical protein